ncbi:hypothetical protein OFW50_09100 [Lacticaseibacillus chiayiensis]|uniref:Uncharacterized protein n=1 Tax=Lacticaseibacillus chiayiensis TaxID=2100821 RepID=A0ABY6H566_9LACO|nr:MULTISPECIES: hypothetical protein [Lacticaseibacillus]UYN55644.1 hypothetical protein OFW50_09100 [Lacticaseibacillus chiayiensis]WBF77183.1 hypothetical protein [Lacticaseibacillus phage R10.1]
MEYIALITLIIVIAVIRVLLTKSDKDSAHSLRKQFNEWLVSSGPDRPSNDTFRQLYRRATGNRQALTPVVRDLGPMYQRVNADLLDNFPSKIKQFALQQLTMIDNLVDYYDARWNENFVPAFWIRFFVYWPQKLVGYLGIKEDGVAAKLANVLGWLIEFIFLIYKPLLKKLL